MKYPEVEIRWVFGENVVRLVRAYIKIGIIQVIKISKACCGQEMKTNRTTPNNRLSTIIRDKEKEKSLLPEKTISGEGHVIKKQAENSYNTEP